MSDDQDLRQYHVVVNHEEQYSIWLADKDMPAGWEIVLVPQDWQSRQDDGLSSKEMCLAYIDEVWTDMRPLSLRKALAKQE